MNRNFLLYALMIGVLLSSCSQKPKIDEWEDDIQERFDKGMKYYNKKKYYRAQEDFNYVIVSGSHTELGDDALFYLGESYFNNKEYLLAINEFDRLTKQMLYSEYVEKARFRICQSYVKLSPRYYRDQKYTFKAIDKLQEFIEDYPNSEYLEESNKLFQDMRNKLAKKVYESGILYIKMEEYKSALLYFEDLLTKYYDTDFADKSRLKIVEVYLKMDDGETAKKYLDDNSTKFRERKLLESARYKIVEYSRKSRKK